MEKTVQLGFEPHISASQKKVPMNRVLVGDFQSDEVAKGALKDLSEEGINGKVIKKSNGRYSVNAGAFFFEKEAKALKRKLEDFGYDVLVDKAKVSTTMQDLRVGRYATKDAAQADLERLRSQGLQPVIIAR